MTSIGFFGTPSHAAELLELLIRDKAPILFVVCNPDKPTGRKKILTPPPVKEVAMRANIPVLQFESIRSPEAVASINSFGADLYLIYAYGKLIPEEIFSHPVLGTINLHGSLLPDLRGASPVQTALLKNYKITGITLQYIVKELDAGDVISQKEIPIEPEDTTATLFAKMTREGYALLKGILETDSRERFPATPQDHSSATHCKKLLPEDRIIHFSETAESVHNRIRTFDPPPHAYCMFRGKRLGLLGSELFPEGENFGPPGELKIVDKKQLWVNCGDRSLRLKEVQPESKNRMTAEQFINGFRITDGEILE